MYYVNIAVYVYVYVYTSIHILWSTNFQMAMEFHLLRNPLWLLKYDQMMIIVVDCRTL